MEVRKCLVYQLYSQQYKKVPYFFYKQYKEVLSLEILLA